MDCGLRAERFEEQVSLRYRTGKRAVTCVARIFADACILFANRVYTFDYFVRTESSVFIVEAVSQSV